MAFGSGGSRVRVAEPASLPSLLLPFLQVFTARRLVDPRAGQSLNGVMMQRILEHLAVLNPVVRLFRTVIPCGAPSGAVAALFFLLAGSVQGASDERPLQGQEVLAASRIIFCSGHPDIEIEHVREAVLSWGVGSKSLILGTSFRKGTDSSGDFFVIIEDDAIEPTLSNCIATYPQTMQNALADVVDRIGQPVPNYSPIANFLGPINGTGLSLRGDEWIGKIAVTALHGEDARTSLNDILRPAR